MAPAVDGTRFITFEGGEGAGKSTQIAHLAAALRNSGFTVSTTREPGGSPGADAIRRLLVEGATDRWDGETESLLHFAARRDHLSRTIWPALADGEWVLCDRFSDSTMAYQGYGHGVDRSYIETLYELAVGDFRPQLTLILDLPVEVGLARAANRNNASSTAEDRYERMDVAFHERLRQGFLDIAAREPERCAVIDATHDVAAIAGEIRTVVAERLDVALNAI